MPVWVTICITVSVAAALLQLLRWKATASSRRDRLPPGPQGWPLVGNIFDLGTLPHVSLAKMSRKYGPLVWIRLGAVNTLIISSAEAAAELFKIHDHTFCNRHLIQAFKSDEAMSSIVALSEYGPFWRAMRRLYANEIFSRKRIQESVDLRRRCVDKMINWIKNEANGTSIEVAPFVLATSFNLIGNLVLSRDLVDPKSTKGNEFFHLSSELTELVIKPNLADFFPSLRWLDPQGIQKKVKRKLDLILEIISGFVEERRADNKQELGKQGNDFLDVLLEYEGNGKDEPDKIPDRLLNMLILELLTAGIFLAEKMLHLVLGSLLQNFEWVLEDGDTPESLDMGEKLESVIKKAIPLRAIPRPFVV
ncbi:hypothetical protein MKX03_000933 [Papaver bracteatum]|nr:hypothetical protein MKX03_000933 [Papaver bracteatum]